MSKVNNSGTPSIRALLAASTTNEVYVHVEGIGGSLGTLEGESGGWVIVKTYGGQVWWVRPDTISRVQVKERFTPFIPLEIPPPTKQKVKVD